MLAFREAYARKDAKKRIELRDESGERLLAGRRSAAGKAIHERTLREEVQRDLEALFNTVSMESSQDLSAWPRVRRSILNFGLPDISHRTIDEHRVAEIADEIGQALATFEPRLSRHSIRVTRDDSVGSDSALVRFSVKADLWFAPFDVPVQFVADVHLDTGEIAVTAA